MLLSPGGARRGVSAVAGQGVAMAMVAVLGALVGAGVWVAIRSENGLDARPGPGRGAACGRRCSLGDDLRMAGRRSPGSSVT